MPQFKKGDVVKLKSGGPSMTITEVTEREIIRCKWFAGNKLEEGYFPIEALIVPTKEKDSKKEKNANS